MAAHALRNDNVFQIEPEYRSLEEKYARFDKFLKGLWSDVYPEYTSTLHDQITASVWQRVKETYPIPAGAKVLDVGCGQGVALKHFAADNLDAIGIAIGEDVNICRQQGFNAVEMDLSFLEFADESFDLVWCRHVLEHSVFPLFSLAETYRVLKPGGVLYMEVPAPDTASRHQTNPNHYSVLGKSMWQQLLKRAGYSKVTIADVTFNVPAGPDAYWSFIVKKDD
ncbi:class I SAM-dependent methyltransferase [Rhizobium sp. KVB221]|uniref:Class I SAM-dependent methyltransferase n=1 Tax=Rhizobium setariae TaxID=2801340 RepID=A0A936YTR7_9HYPH|nr:class I SAM-dependent methyltransferase [Rhizobium setariae]MBL0372657.1 class I SAM-dependent methyltransferase [Rhizobium setariae]